MQTSIQNKPGLGANNMPLDVLGEVEITLQLGGVTAQHRVFVCRSLTQEILVGIDFLRTHKCVLNFDTGTVCTKEGPSKMVFGHLDKVCRITVAETITLSPNMVADIPCQVHEAVGLDELKVVLEPSETFSERYAAGAFRTAVTIKDGRVPVRVFNPLNKPLKIYRCSSIRELYPLHGGEELSEEDNVGMNYKIVSPGVSDSDVGVLPEVKQCGAVELEDFENCCVSMEELFPINSDAVPEEEKRRHYEILATYDNCISRGPMDLGTAKGVKHTIAQVLFNRSRCHPVESLFTKEKKYAVK